MKLQKQLSRKVEGKMYPKYVVTISPRQVEKLGWKEGEELDGEVYDDNFVITKKKKE